MRFLVASILGFFTAANSLKCELGSVPDSRSICIRPKYIQGCYTYSTQQQCSQCNYNYSLDQKTGLCSFNPSPSQSCCLEIGVTGGCRQCNRGMTLINNSCVQTDSFGCLEKDDTGDCVNCSSDFVLKNGKCLQGIKNCQVYTNQDRTVCEKCQPTYSLVNGAHCLKNKILGCKSQFNKVCTECFQPFKVNQGQCEIKRCKQYNDFGCQSCQCGFFITKKMTCEKVEQGCVRYQKGICTDCYPPFTLQGSTCTLDGCRNVQGIKCTKCKDEYKLQNGQCVLPNCIKGKNGKCQICKEGYSYNNGECLSSGPSTRVNFNSN